MPKKLTIYTFNDTVLQEKASKVTDLNDTELNSLIEDMIYTVSEKNGVGLAAPQVGSSIRLIVVASKPNKRYPNAPEIAPEAMINPEIIASSTEQEFDWEGCLSVPNTRGKVPRAKKLKLRYTTPSGQTITKTFEGFIARIIQHEIDHLDGISFVERMEDKDDLVTEKEYLTLSATEN